MQQTKSLSQIDKSRKYFVQIKDRIERYLCCCIILDVRQNILGVLFLFVFVICYHEFIDYNIYWLVMCASLSYNVQKAKLARLVCPVVYKQEVTKIIMEIDDFISSFKSYLMSVTRISCYALSFKRNNISAQELKFVDGELKRYQIRKNQSFLM